MSFAPGLAEWKRWTRALFSPVHRAAYRARRRERKEIARLTTLPRHVPAVTSLLGPTMSFVDAASFLWTYRDIFQRELYAFRTDRERPYVIDAGANIGLSILYFKRLYPTSEIVAFEPDPALFAVLEQNVRGFGYGDVHLLECALWSSETTLGFWQEGADGGRIAVGADTATTSVRAVRLARYLERPVDLLKMDIEGAETEVLQDSFQLLRNVAHLYVEYHSIPGQPQTLPGLLDLLVSSGFRIHLEPCSVVNRPFLQNDGALAFDLQLHIFARRT